MFYPHFDSFNTTYAFKADKIYQILRCLIFWIVFLQTPKITNILIKSKLLKLSLKN